MALDDFLQATMFGAGSQAAEYGALFLIPFVHEDLAIVGGALLIASHRLSGGLAVISLYSGMVSSDFLLYGLGAVARRNDAARRILISPRVQHLGDWLRDHMAPIILASRLVPGLIFPSYIACGWFGLSLMRFALMTMATAAVYLPIMLALATAFGEVALEQLGAWAWLGLIAPIVVMAVLRWQFAPRDWPARRVKLSRPRGLLGRPREQSTVTHSHYYGMSRVDRLPRAVSFAERVPPAIFYVPLVIQWLWLGLRYRSWTLPTAANPRIETGGMWGESKSACLRLVHRASQRWLAEFITIRRSRAGDRTEADITGAHALLGAAGLTFPLVAKPDIGWRGFGVRLLNNEIALQDYIRAFPAGETIILQRFVPYDGEAGILYVRRPDQIAGRIVSLTLRYFPYVVGDGKTSVRNLVLLDRRSRWKARTHFGGNSKHLGLSARDLDRVPLPDEIVRLAFIGSNRVGGLYRDGHRHITAALSAQIDAISRAIPEFHVGRYDIRFKTVESLERGEDFSIIEINGIGGESIEVWDPEMPLAATYRRLFRQQSLLFKIGAHNRHRGFQPIGAIGFFRYLRRQNKLLARCPPSS